MVVVAAGGESSFGLGIFSDLPDDKVHAGAGILAGAVPIHCRADMTSTVLTFCTFPQPPPWTQAPHHCLG